jgi:hypothetical protein
MASVPDGTLEDTTNQDSNLGRPHPTSPSQGGTSRSSLPPTSTENLQLGPPLLTILVPIPK